MATPREIKGRIQGVQNTKKITRTMEMVATAKSKKAVERVQMSQPYARKLREVLDTMSALDLPAEHPLLRKVTEVKKVGLLVVGANRGLSGGFNNNVINMAMRRIRELQAQGIEVEVRLVGKKPASVFRYMKVAFSRVDTHIEDKPGYREAEEFAEYYMHAFENHLLDQVEIISTRYLNAAVQKAQLTQVLPLAISGQEQKEGQAVAKKSYVFEPDPVSILAELLPKAIKVEFYQVLLESAASEQIARRIAMKNATDSASDMIKSMTREYNKKRQAKITQEISEIVAGADAIQ